MLSYSTSRQPLYLANTYRISHGLSGLQCGPGQMRGLSDGFTDNSIEQAGVDWFNRIFGAVTGHLPAGAGTPPPGSPGYYASAVPSWLPWAIGGLILYKLIK